LLSAPLSFAIHTEAMVADVLRYATRSGRAGRALVCAFDKPAEVTIHSSSNAPIDMRWTSFIILLHELRMAHLE
jgi:hypothetical protein